MAKNFEVEIKTLLGSKENADKLIAALKAKNPDTKLVGKGKQLNHYFNTTADPSKLQKSLETLLNDEQKKDLQYVLTNGKKISVRTRDADGKVLFVIKASLGDDSSSNGVKRIEFEAVVNKTLGELDEILLAAGCTYQAKWSREREEYENGDMHVCIDKNAGYGYLAEFEKTTPDEGKLDEIKSTLLSEMKELGVSELSQDRLERMFAHYNSHWGEYYGTEKTFIIE